MHYAQNCSFRHIFLGPGTRQHRNWSQWCFTPHIWGWNCAASALSSLPPWCCWFRHCSGRAHGEGTLACTCQKMDFARPNDFEIIALMVRGTQGSLPKSLPTLLVCRPLAGRMGALGQSVVFHILCLPQPQTSRVFLGWCRYSKSPFLEYRTRNEVTEGKGAGRAQVTSSLLPGALSLTGVLKCSWILRDWDFTATFSSNYLNLAPAFYPKPTSPQHSLSQLVPKLCFNTWIYM